MKKSVLVLSVVLVLFLLPLIAKAGFGISPPYVRNKNLTRGSHYEQKIVLVRSDPVEDLKTEININVPKANNWISIDKGTEFILSKGEQQVPIIVNVDVPKNADFGSYKGTIRIRTIPLQPPEGGTVAIALGAQIDVDLDVVKANIFDFKIRGINSQDLEKGWKIKLTLKIENIGNIKAAPTKVHLDIYDSSEENLLESVDNSNRLAKIKPFETKEIVAEFPNKLGSGSYWAKFKIFKGDEVVNQGKVHLSVLPQGSLPEPATIGILNRFLAGFALWIWLVIVLVIVLISIGYWIWRKKKRK